MESANHTQRSISDFLKNISTIENISEKFSILDKRTDLLEGEWRKLYWVKHMFPLCMSLLEDAIKALKHERWRWALADPLPTTTEMPAMMTSSSSDDSINKADLNERKEWMRSVQLWSDPNEKQSTEMVKQAESAPHETSSAMTETNNRYSSLPSQMVIHRSVCSKKPRRKWTGELSSLFIRALDQLGGLYVAKPKPMLNLMKSLDPTLTEGLTLTELKSHLQNYRKKKAVDLGGKGIPTQRTNQAHRADGATDTVASGSGGSVVGGKGIAPFPEQSGTQMMSGIAGYYPGLRRWANGGFSINTSTNTGGRGSGSMMGNGQGHFLYFTGYGQGV